MTRFDALLLSMLLSACSAQGRGGYPPGGGGGDGGGAEGDLGSSAQGGCGAEMQGCYTVYAHGDHILYKIDLANKLLVTVGPFNAPQVPTGSGKTSEDVLTDLAVNTDNLIYVISKTNLYTADPGDGHVTLIGPVTACGTDAVALTFMPDGSLYTADYKGAFCRIDPTTTPPTVTPIGTLGGGMAISGDIVAVADGTMYGTAYKLSDASGTGTQKNNLLVKMNPATGQVEQTLGSTGFPNLFGIAFSQGQVFGFTHSGSGDVVTIDPKTGVGTLYNTFNDPSTGKGISFAGAGVNALVPPTIQ